MKKYIGNGNYEFYIGNKIIELNEEEINEMLEFVFEDSEKFIELENKIYKLEENNSNMKYEIESLESELEYYQERSEKEILNDIEEMKGSIQKEIDKLLLEKKEIENFIYLKKQKNNDIVFN